MGSFGWLLGFLTLGSASAQLFELEGRYWITRTDSQVRVERLGLATDIDLRKDLGVNEGHFPEGQVTFSRGGARFRFAFTPIQYSGDQNVGRTIIFNGRTYTFGARVIFQHRCELSAIFVELLFPARITPEDWIGCGRQWVLAGSVAKSAVAGD